MRFSIQPRDYPMSLRAMTKEKLQFELPVVFTIGPDVNMHGDGSANSAEADKGDALMKYSMLLADSANKGDAGDEHIGNIIKGIIEGETRVLVSAMSKNAAQESRFDR
jgi:flotillin